MRLIGFSTGAIALSDFRKALSVLRTNLIKAVELSALRLDEFSPLVNAIPTLDLSAFQFVSVHAPSKFPADQEENVLNHIASLAEKGYSVVVHPDVISNFNLWRKIGHNLLIENMDKRKACGRTVEELAPYFHQLPDARFCFDIGHARQVDPSMTEAALLLRAFGDRLAEVHISEVNTASRHDPLSLNAVRAFAALASQIPEDIPIILESLIDHGQSDIETERARALQALSAA